MRTLLVGTLILGLSPLVSGCTTLQAKKAPVELPALDVPPPPPRVVEPAPAPEPPPEPVPDLPPPSAAPPKPRPQAKPTTNEPKPEPPKPEPPPDTTASAPPAAPPQVPQLRTPQTADGAEAEKNVRATIDRAKSTLGGVNYNGLSNERKKVYNDAKSFNQQAQDASRQGNFVLAQASATKA
jgi:outer membrane biosynthesis protein TonB